MLSTVLAASAYAVTRAHLVEERTESVTARAYVNARLVRSALRAEDAQVPDVLSSLGGDVESVVLARVGGEWFSGSVATSPSRLPGSLTRAVGDDRAGRQVVRLDGDPYVVVGVPVPAVDTQYYELAAMEDIEDTLDGLGRSLAVVAGIVALAGAAVGWWASGRVLQPLRRMASAAERIAGGSLDTRLDAVGDPDLEVLEQSFNRMADVVQERIDREIQFTSDVSHELRTPLTAMLSGIAVARRRRRDPEAVDEALAELEERGEEFRTLVTDLLEISRVDAGAVSLELEVVDPVQLVEAVLRNLQCKDVPVRVRDGGGGPVRADRRRLGQMVANLVDNADRHGGGASCIEVGGDDRFVTIAVEDDGPGVPEQDRTYVFQRFARGESARSAPGSGLGLALVAEHARLHGGDVRVEQAAGGGARFVIEIPRGIE